MNFFKKIFTILIILTIVIFVFNGCEIAGEGEVDGDNCSGNNIPVVNQIGHTTSSNLPTHIWSTVSDSDGNISKVTVKQTVDGDLIGYTFTLYDDGTHGDNIANDGKYEYSFVEGVDTRYYTTSPGHLYTVTAVDSCAATGTNSW